jgi:two-component system chemotaxis response regulator CheY
MIPATIALKKVLLVGHDPRFRAMTGLRLGVLDLEVFEAASAGEALGLLEEKKLHLVVTEWPLPGGEETVLFNAWLKNGQVPIIFCSSPNDGVTEVPVPVGVGHALISKADRPELTKQVARLLSEIPANAFSKYGGHPNIGPARQILIIDDSQTFRGILRRTFEKAYPGDVVREAEDGRQALSQMTRQRVDLIVTDLEMPGMDGLTFLKHLKGNPILSQKPVLILSGNITEEMRAQAAPMPHVRLLNKSAQPEEIILEVSLMGYGKTCEGSDPHVGHGG